MLSTPVDAMTTVVAAVNPLWVATRATGVVALLLLTGAIVLGVVDVARWTSPRWPRFVVDGLHRTVSLLAVAFVVVHVVTTVVDGFVDVGWLDAVVPFAAGYRALFVGLGAVAFDLLLAVGVTSALRRRIGHRAWRAVHWGAYACWPVALIHSLGTGTDALSLWMLVVAGLCVAAVTAAVVARFGKEQPGVERARAGGSPAGRGSDAIGAPSPGQAVTR
jgi:predicted ferric reductase